MVVTVFGVLHDFIFESLSEPGNHYLLRMSLSPALYKVKEIRYEELAEMMNGILTYCSDMLPLFGTWADGVAFEVVLLLDVLDILGGHTDLV